MKNKLVIAGLVVLSSVMIGCGPAKVLDVVDIAPNETVWVVPLDSQSQSGQVKFDSVEFLNQKKISTKRVMVDKVSRSTGWMWWDYEWIPVVRVIKVDRCLVTKEWTDDEKSGTKAKKEGIGVQTRDSIKLRVGLTITASIDEQDASTYLYYHGEQPLSNVIDKNVRSFAVAELTDEYSKLTLTEAQTSTTTIYKNLFEAARKVFKEKGITIQYLGNSEGLTYADEKVQDGINKSYLAEQDVKTANQEQLSATIRNKTKVMTAEAEADAAKKTFEVKDASSLNNELQIKLI